MFRSVCSRVGCTRPGRNLTLHRPKIIPKPTQNYSFTNKRNYSDIPKEASVIPDPVPVTTTATSVPVTAPAPPVDVSLVQAALPPGGQSWTTVLEDMLTVPFDYLHQWTGLPWWGTLVGVGFVLRLFLAPLQVRQLRHSLESSKLLLTLDKIQKESIPVEPQDLDKARYRMLDLAKMNFRSIFKITFFQMAAFFGVLRLSHVEPLKTQLKTGGYSWFTDLTAVDPTYRLALGASLLIMCTIYWPFIASRRPPTRLIATLALILPVIGIAVSTQFPASWLVYMCGTALYSFVAAVVLSVPSVRKRLDLPPHFVEPDLSLFKSVSQAQVDMKEIKNETPKTP